MICLRAAKYQKTLKIKERILNKMIFPRRKQKKSSKRRKPKHDKANTCYALII